MIFTFSQSSGKNKQFFDIVLGYTYKTNNYKLQCTLKFKLVNNIEKVIISEAYKRSEKKNKDKSKIKQIF